MAKLGNKRQAQYTNVAELYQQALNEAGGFQGGYFGTNAINLNFGKSAQQKAREAQLAQMALEQQVADAQAMQGKNTANLAMNTALTDAGVDNKWARFGLEQSMNDAGLVGNAGAATDIANAQARAQVAMTSPQYSQRAAATAEYNQQLQQANLLQAQANAAKSQQELQFLEDGVLPPEMRIQAEQNLRSRFASDWTNYGDALQAYQRLDNLLSSADINPTSAYAAVIALAKILDPGSVVRDSEQRAVVQSSDGMVQNLWNSYKKLEGGGIGESTINNLRQASQQVIMPYVEGALSTVDAYESTATRYNIRPEDVYMGKDSTLDAVRQGLGLLVVVE